jgi:hypothetical protein
MIEAERRCIVPRRTPTPTTMFSSSSTLAQTSMPGTPTGARRSSSPQGSDSRNKTPNAGCVNGLHVQHAPVYDHREALRPPTRFLPLEEEGYEEEG